MSKLPDIFQLLKTWTSKPILLWFFARFLLLLGTLRFESSMGRKAYKAGLSIASHKPVFVATPNATTTFLTEVT
ncbi:hypothetical protein F4803DRAFT_536966 [Xylaria telfairii]|nr:hypothetical protein F4803DRAFT_536966 [Xylaria telfairii]